MKGSVLAVTVGGGDRSKRAGGRSPEAHEIHIGMDVLELVSTAMYVDPMTVHREYVQNAADSVEVARRTGVLQGDELGIVDVTVDPGPRRIRIRDNGAGIPADEFVTRLTSLGGSRKRGTDARGFRGVGRLAGLAYAQELVFRSRVEGEETVSELRWDCRKLRNELRNPPASSDVVDLIRSVVSVSRVDPAGMPARFFEVELNGVVRIRTDKLMNPRAIADYLGQVAPVPFSRDFRLGADISRFLQGTISVCELDINVSGVDGPLRRPHRNTFAIDEGVESTFTELQTVEIPGIDGGTAAVAWVLHHDYEGAIPAQNSIKGLRLRSGNIQVGEHALLEEMFAEPRFNSWSVGEIHVVDRRIIPNGRRDHYEQNAHFQNLLNHLTPLAKEIGKRCRWSSVKRKHMRDFATHGQVAREKIAILGQGALQGGERGNLTSAVEQSISEMARIAGMDLLAEDAPEVMKQEVATLRQDLAHALDEGSPMSSPLARLSEDRRRMYEHLFELVYECSTNRTAAKALIAAKTIQAELKLGGKTVAPKAVKKAATKKVAAKKTGAKK